MEKERKKLIQKLTDSRFFFILFSFFLSFFLVLVLLSLLKNRQKRMNEKNQSKSKNVSFFLRLFPLIRDDFFF